MFRLWKSRLFWPALGKRIRQLAGWQGRMRSVGFTYPHSRLTPGSRAFAPTRVFKTCCAALACQRTHPKRRTAIRPPELTRFKANKGPITLSLAGAENEEGART